MSITVGNVHVHMADKRCQVPFFRQIKGVRYHFLNIGLNPIDEVRVYNRALSASEILDLYRLGAGRMKIRQ